MSYDQSQALDFAFEEKMEITKLVAEPLQRLPIAFNRSKLAKKLLERINAFTRDAASKGLKA